MMTRESLIFNSILNFDSFSILTTGDKIKKCLDLEIFKVPSIDPLKDSLNFEIFNDEEFSFNYIYELEGNLIELNYLIVEEIFQAVCTASKRTRVVEKAIESLEFDLSITTNDSDKVEIIKSELRKLDIFNLGNIEITYDSQNLELELKEDQSEFLIEGNHISDWIFGILKYPIWNQLDQYPEIKKFYYDYQKFFIAQIYLSELRELSDLVTQEKIHPEKFTAYQQAYFLEKIGVIKILSNSNLSGRKVAKLVSKIINRDFDNTRRDIREFNTKSTDQCGRERKKARLEIEDLIKSITTWG